MTKLGTIVLLFCLAGLGWFGYPAVRERLWPPPAAVAMQKEKGPDLSAADVLAYGRKVLQRHDAPERQTIADLPPDQGPGCAGIADKNRRVLCESEEQARRQVAGLDPVAHLDPAVTDPGR